LGEAIYRDIREYSTGMRQRFKLAQAIVHDPAIVFLDEPLSGLDPAGRDELLDLIRALATEHGKHVVWSSHILPEVQKAADAIVVLHEGRCRGTFRLEDLHPRAGAYELTLEGDASPFRAAMAAAGVTLDAVVREGEAPEEAAHGTRRTSWVALLPEGTAPSSLLVHARASGVRVRRLAPRVESLEEVFHRLLATAEAR
jgi:ABC-2 type transport system ATP-binding protein